MTFILKENRIDIATVFKEIIMSIYSFGKSKNALKVNKTTNMLEGPILPALLSFAFPLIISGVLQQLYNTADTLVVGAMGGKEALAAVGATGAIISLLINIFANFYTGCNILVARAKGTKDDVAMTRIVSTTYIVTIFIGIFLTLLAEILARPMLEWTDCPQNIIDESEKYLRIYFAGVPASMFMNFGASVIRSSGDSRSPFIYMGISGFVNVVCNVVFVLLFGDPVAAVAIATIISQYLSAAQFAIHLIKDKSATGLRPFKFEFHSTTFVKTLKLGIPSAISAGTFALTNLIIQPVVNSFGDIAISGSAASSTIEAYLYVITQAVGAGVATFMGQNIGAGKKERVKQVLIKGYAFNITAMAIFTAVVLSLGKILLGCFIPGETEAIEFGFLRLCMIVGASVINSIMNVNGGALQAYGKTFLQMLSNLIGVCLFRIIWMIFLYGTVLEANPFNFLVCYPVTWSITAFTLLTVVIVLTKKYLGGKEYKL